MQQTPRRRRWLWTLTALALLLAIGSWWVNRQLEPNRLTATVLRRAGESLQLQLQFKGQPDYALKPEPRLLIPNFSVSGVDGEVFLFARRAEISLPWSTITGDEPVITRIELDQPVIDLPGLRRWLATRPPRPFELPTLSKGIEISGGTIKDDAYSISKLDLDLPRLKTGEPAKVATSGTFMQGKTNVYFDIELGASTPGLESDFSLQGRGSLQQSPEPLKFQLRSDGHYVSEGGKFSVDAKALKIEGASPLPNVDGKAKFELAEQMHVDFDGLLRNWPTTWPALPQPLASDAKDLPFRISYLGKPDLSDAVSLLVTREPTVLQASLRIEELQSWIATTNGPPLPPLDATLRTPSLVFDGIELQGVEIEISDGEASATPP